LENLRIGEPDGSGCVPLGAIIGGIVGGVALLTVIIIAICCSVRARRRRKLAQETPNVQLKSTASPGSSAHEMKVMTAAPASPPPMVVGHVTPP